MRFILIFLALNCLMHKVPAQVVFSPIGAEWHYLFVFSIFKTYYNENIKYVRDSVVATENVKVLKQKNFYNLCNPPGNRGNVITVIKQRGDTVFFRNQATLNTWQILYNFATPAGQSWTTTINSIVLNSVSLTFTTTVDSVSYVTINNFLLKKLFVRQQYSGTTFFNTSEIIERLGSTKFLFNYIFPLGPNPGAIHCDGATRFLCYGDSAFGLEKFANQPCDFVDGLSLKENNYQNYNVRIYPNPANCFLTIESEATLPDELQLEFSNAIGTYIKRIQLHSSEPNFKEVDVKDLSKGMYVLRIFSKNENIYLAKFIKE